MDCEPGCCILWDRKGVRWFGHKITSSLYGHVIISHFIQYMKGRYENRAINPVDYMTLHELNISTEKAEKVHFDNNSLRENNSFHIRFMYYSMLQHETLTHCLKVCFKNKKVH